MTIPNLIWRPTPNGEARTKPVTLIVLHDCQGSYQGSIATFLNTTPGHRVSAHLVLKEDGSEVTQMVDFGRAAWHCVAFNQGSIGLEMAGYAERGYADAELQNAADIIACLCHLFKIPPQWAHQGAGTGITTHFDLGKRGGGHSDPWTDTHQTASFMARVKAAYDAGGFPASWGHGCPVHTDDPTKLGS